MLTGTPAGQLRKGLKLTSAPVLPALDRDSDVKGFLRMTGTSENDFLDALILAAATIVENYTSRKLITQTWEFWLDRFPGNSYNNMWWQGVKQAPVTILNGPSGYIDLPFSPVSSITSIITYDQSNTTSIFSSASYVLDDANAPPRVFLNDNQVWPANLRNHNAVKITAVYGYGTTGATIPRAIKIALLQTVAWMYENRGECDEKDLPLAVQSILQPYRILEI